MTYTHNHNINEGGAGHIMKAHNPLSKHIPPHERKALIHIDFSDDVTLFKRVYGDEDEAAAAIQVLMDAPPEIQIIAAQLIGLIEEVA